MLRKNLFFSLGFIFSILLISCPSLSFGEKGTVSVESFDVHYDIENGILESIFLDPDFIELLITMNTSSDGTFEITIPRNLLDAKFDASDDVFFILVDGFETDYVEINSDSDSRTLVIPFFSGDSVIDIIGTNALNPFSTEPEIPSWIKNNAGWWAGGQIDDTAFIQGIQYLITEGIMTIPQTESVASSGNEIPSWIKNNAGWWAGGQIDDTAFIQGIQYLITNGILDV
ncbi:hypothetical protein [Nitrosopumilus sp.]|uniref:hypothetical protein n=1 Tax=Nitrosopumilus sp. TaxID=2024843 RepID=UPI00247D7035|nr:hypothetical protein [Nitrosopumilus sp.]MCV0411282.1 hypothetical protein [Nitrosopumilus sp.]